MPHVRRMSNNSVASASSQQSFPATINSSTKVTKEKVGKIMSRRMSRRQPKTEDKENATENVLQSPTPYWKVAKERGTTTPPQTRSAKKQKRTPGTKALDFSAGNDSDAEKTSLVLTFSPPDQKENARREQEELKRKEQARASKVRKARESGQLLVFSPTLRNPAPLPPSPCEDQNNNTEDVEMTGEEAAVALDEDRSGSDGDLENSTDTCSPTDMEVECPHGSEKSQVSLVTAHSNIHNDLITQELKNLRETINKLVDRKSTASETNRHHVSLEAHMIRTEKVLLENSRLEQKIEILEDSLKKIESEARQEKEGLAAETTRLQTELAVLSAEANAQVETLQQMKTQMEAQMKASQSEKDELMRQIQSLENELEEARSRLDASKKQVESLKEEMAAEKEALADEHAKLASSNLNLDKEFGELTKANASLKASLTKYEEKIDLLENTLLPESEEQLQRALEKLKASEINEANLREEMTKLEDHVASLKEELSRARSEQQQERNHFQELNEESSNAYQHIKKSLQEKDDTIADLKASMDQMEASLVLETEKLNDASKELKTVRASMGERANELEQMLEEVTAELQKTTNEKQALEEKLALMCEEMEENASFKNEVLARSNETSAANQLLQQRIMQLEQELRASKTECDEVKQKIVTFDQREADLFNKLQESDRVRRGLHNRVMQLSGNIRVYVRVRPVLPGEKEASTTSSESGADTKKRKHEEIDDESPFRYPGLGGNESNKSSFGADDPTKNLLEVTEPWRDRGGLSERRKKWMFGFDNIFTPAHGQNDIWEATEPLVQSAVDGYNVCLFAFGQTGSGKTFTMLGEPGNEGLVSRSVQKLFAARQAISELTRGSSKVEISVELLEIYNEKVRDLLDNKTEGQEVSLKVKANEAIGSTVVVVNTEEEVATILGKAQSRRCVKATASNAVSSRSHMLFTLHFKVLSKDGSTRVGKLNICDLAGSERLGKSNANEHVGGALLKETKHINTSLSVLSNVIEKLQAGDSNVPYRESKLTHLLQNSLGGNSKTLAIVCCNPLQSHFHESLCSLRFAAKVNKVDLKAVSNFSA